jgi:hypothetical protein
MRARTFWASLACGLLVAAASCQDTPVAVEDTLDLPTSLASVHLKGGKKAAPTYTDLGLSLLAEGALAGLGNEDILVTLTATANVNAVCQNNGGNQAPGQNPAPITVTGTQSIPAEEIKNGNVRFSVMTKAPPRLIPGAPDCPNPNWDEIILDLDFTTATITVEQPAGSTVFTRFDVL